MPWTRLPPPKEAAAGAHGIHMRSRDTRTRAHSGAHTTVLDLPILTCVCRVAETSVCVLTCSEQPARSFSSFRTICKLSMFLLSLKFLRCMCMGGMEGGVAGVRAAGTARRAMAAAAGRKSGQRTRSDMLCSSTAARVREPKSAIQKTSNQ